MVQQWLRRLCWRPFAMQSRNQPYVPFHATVTQPVAGVTCIQINNRITRCLSHLGGGYDFAVCYLIDQSLLIDTGFSWARQCLRQVLEQLGADQTITTVINTHYHEDHTGNNDLLYELTGAPIMAHPLAIPEIRFPSNVAWYRDMLFGPSNPTNVMAIPAYIDTPHFRFEVHHMPGHCPGHLCLFEPQQRWLFSGDLYLAADMDSQLADADGPLWIASLERAMALCPSALFDAHGTIVIGQDEVRQVLERKRDFLIDLRERTYAAAEYAQPIEVITQRVFGRNGLVDDLSLSDGWLSLVTGSDFSRSHLLKSFLRDRRAP